MTNQQKLDLLKSQSKILGVDTSACQGNIDWEYIHATYPWIKFAIIKCADGKYIDSKFKASWESLGKTGITRCIYSVVHPNETIDQIQATINSFKDVYPHAILIDFETSYINAKTTADLIKSEFAMYSSQFNVPVIMYSYYGFIKPFISLLGDVEYLIANYSQLDPAHIGIPDNKMVGLQFSGWNSSNGCSGIVNGQWCRQNHDHGVMLKLSEHDLGTGIDIDTISEDLWKRIQIDPNRK